MARMTKDEALSYLGAVKDGTAECPLCRLQAARLIIRYPQGIAEEWIALADTILWSYKGDEKHS